MIEEGRRREKRWLEMQIRFLQALIESISTPVSVVDASFRPRFVNKAFKELAGCREWSDEQGVHCYQLAFGFEQPCAELGHSCPLPEVLAGGRPVVVTHAHRLPSGEIRHFEITGSPLCDEEGDLVGVIESFRDITARKIAEELSRRNHDILEQRVAERTAELVKAKEEADLIYSVIPSAIFTVDMAQRITSWNDKAEEVTGFRREEVIGKKCDIFALRPCTTRCGLFSEKKEKPIMGKKCEIRTKDGSVRIASKNADLLHDADGRVIGGIESFEDITDRSRVEGMLRAERDKLHSMLSAMGHGMHILNRNFEIVYQNLILREHFGDKIGQKCYTVYKQLDGPCEVCRMRQAIDSNEIQRTELLMSDGRYYEQSYAPFRDVDGQTKALILLRDITEEKAFQAETMRAGQLAAIGELAAGVAHEINNPINGIINYAQILLDEQRDGAPAAEILDRVIREGERISGIVRNLLSFARQDNEEMEEVAIGPVLDDSLALLRHQFFKDGIQIATHVVEGLPPVRANAQQLQQVFLNLLSNARYALNQRYSGRHDNKRLEITSRLVHLDKRPYVRTTVTDYGTGIPKEIVNHIFKPFYSMKKPGEGTGLGLSISHGLVKDFNGFLWVDSKVDQYTTMTVDLPVVPATPA
ncbi:MAG: PAS domain-containing protein [Desulfobacteraceae bacterium]|nr:PAS domain-containing protein [Desulfobacteraceae bacterium]